MSMTVQGLREQITANSRAWHLAKDEKERRALHDENVKLYGELDARTGSVSTYDAKSGVWSTSRPGTEDYQAMSLAQPRNLSAEVEARQKAATARSVAALGRAKGQAERTLDAQEQALGGVYQAAKNRTAAQSEIARKNLSEQAAQSGLNSGAAGQAALAQNVAAQGELAALEGQEAQARAELNQARQEMERDYALAVAEAQAEGDYALAQALYDEAARYDQAQREQARIQEGIARDVYQMAQSNRQAEAQAEERGYQRGQDAARWARELAQQEAEQARQKEEDAIKIAQSRAAFGDFQGYAALGYSQAEIDRMTQLWRYYQFIR